MNKWIQNKEDWFNIDDFCHIWIEKRYIIEEINYEPVIKATNYYAMGKWRHNGEKVIISQDWDSKDELINCLNRKLNREKNDSYSTSWQC